MFHLRSFLSFCSHARITASFWLSIATQVERKIILDKRMILISYFLVVFMIFFSYYYKKSTKLKENSSTLSVVFFYTSLLNSHHVKGIKDKKSITARNRQTRQSNLNSYLDVWFIFQFPFWVFQLFFVILIKCSLEKYV